MFLQTHVPGGHSLIAAGPKMTPNRALDRRAPRRVGEGNCPSRTFRGPQAPGAPDLCSRGRATCPSARPASLVFNFSPSSSPCASVPSGLSSFPSRRLPRGPAAPPASGAPLPAVPAGDSGTTRPLHPGPRLHLPRIRSPQTPGWTLTPGAPSPSQYTHPGRGQERGAPPHRSGARRVPNPGAAPGGEGAREGAREAAAKVPAAAAAARRAKDADSSPAGPPHPQRPSPSSRRCLGSGGGTAASAALRAGAARALGAAGGSAAVAALCAFSGRRAGVHGVGRADAAAAVEVWPGNPNETPRQPAQGVG